MTRKGVKNLCRDLHIMKRFNLLVCASVAIVIIGIILFGSGETVKTALLITSPVWLLQIVYETAYLLVKAAL